MVYFLFFALHTIETGGDRHAIVRLFADFFRDLHDCADHRKFICPHEPHFILRYIAAFVFIDLFDALHIRLQKGIPRPETDAKSLK